MRAEPPAAPLAVHEVPVEVVRPLRHLVLRSGRPFETVVTQGDASPETWHLAAFAGSVVVGVVTLFPQPAPDGGDEPAQRLRWMAVHPDWQGRGVGTLLLGRALELAAGRGATRVWAHGRNSALRFYAERGFRLLGDTFTDPDTGIEHTLVITEVGAPRLSA